MKVVNLYKTTWTFVFKAPFTRFDSQETFSFFQYVMLDWRFPAETSHSSLLIVSEENYQRTELILTSPWWMLLQNDWTLFRLSKRAEASTKRLFRAGIRMSSVLRKVSKHWWHLEEAGASPEPSLHRPSGHDVFGEKGEGKIISPWSSAAAAQLSPPWAPANINYNDACLLYTSPSPRD